MKKKYHDPTFHSLAHGGFRHCKFSSDELQLIKSSLWLSMKQNPSQALNHYVDNLKNLGYFVNTMFISRIFKSWRWSFKKPNRSHLLKYTSQNIKNYVNFSVWILNIPWLKLKFVDEVSFVSRSLLKSKVLGPINEKIISIDYSDLTQSFTATALLNLQKPNNPIFLDFRQETNTQADFLLFIIQAIESGNLMSGDILVIDNARVHGGYDTWPILELLLNTADIQIVFLPMYSPELNPIELVFAQVKRYLRIHRNEKNCFLDEIIKAFISVEYSSLLHYYHKTTQAIFKQN